MKRFACGDVVPGCDAVFLGESDTAILTQVDGHARDTHGLTEFPVELVAQVRSAIRAA